MEQQIYTYDSLEEIKKHGHPRFPFQTYDTIYKKYPLESMALHWHRELEFNIILNGTVLAQIDGISYELHPGDAVFINSNILHSTKAAYPGRNTRHMTLILAPEFLAPKESDIYCEEIQPLLVNPSFGGFCFSQKIPWQREVIRLLSSAAYAHRHPDTCCKMQILADLSTMWVLLKDGLTQEQKISSMDKDVILKERTQKMLSYIHNHYQDSISIEDIAGAARISRSECFRCFQKYVCQKPFEYIISYRLRKAANLLKTTNLPISEISICCGFNYQSYFGKRFQEYYQMTPTAYRRHTN